MKVTNTFLDGVKIIHPDIHKDSRGFFLESFSAKKYKDAGIGMDFVQDNYSSSTKGVLRGLHFQVQYPQGKLVRVTLGRVFDVVADINKKSETFGRYFAIELDAEQHTQLYIPPGYAHGFLVLSESAHFQYKCTDYYYPGDESGVMWNDELLNIEWPIKEPFISKKDSCYQALSL
ncbi:dTDP-4-dehydrorhamnose 3,5-epimerase [Gammaproteobacteria bacterium]|nr:dTDP-4-dehydrorhamnose 3,5-epimerase [Gammaproteobacteria bacterium]MDC0090022.1 dTDP-4-dehydrorhamnose 3,5-epimerase [Gammaproteobacteria bacterium]